MAKKPISAFKIRFPKREFFGKRILVSRHETLITGGRKLPKSSVARKVTYGVLTGRETEFGKEVRRVEKEYRYDRAARTVGAKNWTDITLNRFGKTRKVRGQDSIEVAFDETTGRTVRHRVRHYTDKLVVVEGRVVPKIDFSKIRKAVKMAKVADSFEPKDYALVKGSMSITITPDWTYANILARKKDNTVRKGEYLSRRRRNKYYLQSMFRRRKMDLSVSVGFLHPNDIHEGAVTRISYIELIARLALDGYDPLMPLRAPSYIARIRRSMGKEMARVLNSDTRAGLPTLRGILARYGREMADYCYRYIAGGIKPPLAEDTIRNRKERYGKGKATYPRGLDEPLVETGALMNEVGYRVDTGFLESNHGEDEPSEEPKREKAKVKERTDKGKSEVKTADPDSVMVDMDTYNADRKRVAQIFMQNTGRLPEQTDIDTMMRRLGYVI